MHRYLFLLIFSGIIMTSCEKYPGFKRAGHGVHIQLHRIGEDSMSIKPGDYVTADLIYKTMNDSEFFRVVRKFRITEPEYKGSIDECLMMLVKGDEATFILDADNFFRITLKSEIPAFISPGYRMKITAGIADVQTEQEYNNEKEAFLNWINDFGDYEQAVLKQYIEKEQLAEKPLASGIYYLPLQEGTGKKVESGDTVLLHYEGRFLDGKLFDSTKKRNQPFQLVYGTEWQVVKGLEEAIGIMREGERSVFIVPSSLAFGATGSTTGIIPPYTSVIFEVEILKVSSPEDI